ncbi:MAG: IclR family transcriptional regulator [Chloroflexota bacterium]
MAGRLRDNDGRHAENTARSKPRYSGALPKAAQVFAALERETWVSASELATWLGVDRSTAYRLAQAMTRLGWLQQDPDTKRYRLGMRLWELGARAISNLDVRSIALPHMREVVRRTGESCDLAILDGGDIVYIEKVDGTREVRAYTAIGQRVPAHAVAMGKAMLSYVTPAERRRRLPRTLVRFSPATVGRFDELDRQCDEVIRRGYAVNIGEHNPEAGGLAVPIRDSRGECIAAVGINVPAIRMTLQNVAKLAPDLLAAAESISREVGYVAASVGLQ